MDHLGTDRAEERRAPCTRCRRRSECKGPCRRLERLLPGPRAGEDALPIPPDVAEAAGRWRQDAGQDRREIFRIFLAHRGKLTACQLECVDLVYGQDLKIREAAAALGVAHVTVLQHLRYAARKVLGSIPTNPRTSGGTHRKGGEAR